MVGWLVSYYPEKNQQLPGTVTNEASCWQTELCLQVVASQLLNRWVDPVGFSTSFVSFPQL